MIGGINMAARYIQQDGDVTYGVNAYMADTVADLDTIDISGDQPGTTCIIVGNSSVYMLDTDKVWREL
jgi:hypothetical protein